MRTWLALLAGTALLLVLYTFIEPFLQPAEQRRHGAEFQRLTGGLGMGAVAAIYWDFSTFDPRLEADCHCSLWPVPGGPLYSPEHRRTVWDPNEYPVAATAADAGRAMRKHLSLLNAAADSVLRLRARSLVIVLCLAGVLTPYLIATAVFEALKAHAATSVEQGADLYVSLNKAGRNGPIPTFWAERFARLSGVTRVVPRLVGRDYVVGPVVVVGLPVAAIPSDAACVEGNPPAGPGQALVGMDLARELNLAVGKSFTLNVNPGIFLRVVGTFRATTPMWSARLVYVDLATAQEVFAMRGEATEILLYTHPGYEGEVYDGLAAMSYAGHMAEPLRIVSKSIAREMFRRGFSRRSGIFSSLYLVAFALAIPAIAVAAGFGFSDRRREIGLYRAAGWQTTEVLELVALENLILAVAGASLALGFAIAWMKLTNGLFIAQFFLPEVGVRPGFAVGTSFLPLTALLAYLLAATLTMVGSIHNTWRTATIPPMEAIK